MPVLSVIVNSVSTQYRSAQPLNVFHEHHAAIRSVIDTVLIIDDYESKISGRGRRQSTGQGAHVRRPHSSQR